MDLMSDQQPDTLNSLSEVLSAIDHHVAHCEDLLALTKAHTSPTKVNEEALAEEIRTLTLMSNGLKMLKETVNSLIVWAKEQPSKPSSPKLPDLF